MVLESSIKDVCSEVGAGDSAKSGRTSTSGREVDQMWISTFHDQVLGFLLKVKSNITENVMVA